MKHEFQTRNSQENENFLPHLAREIPNFEDAALT